MSVVRCASMLALVAVLLPLGAAWAIEPERREVIVAHNRVWDGYVYKENFIPSDQPEMVLLADKDSAVAMVRTQEYYWPLARQTYVAFETLREDIGGDLVIEEGGREIAVVQAAPYSIVYPEGAINGLGYLLWGEEAETGFARYREGEAAFNRRFARARQEMSRYEEALKESAAARLRGEAVEEIEAPPPLPEPSLKLVTEPRRAYRVALPAGEYTVHVRREGRKVPGSERTLRVIDGNAREVLTADIIPEERWTRPLPSNRLGDRIYAAPGARFYVTLSEASRFAETEYLPLVRPQAVAVRGRDMFIRRKPSDVDTLGIIWADGSEPVETGRDRLKVQQTGGAAFGYVVRSAEADERPDLEAFVVTVPDETGSGRGTLTLGGDEAREFQREVVVVGERNLPLALAVALIPLLFGASLRIGRQVRTNRGGPPPRSG